MTIRPGYAKLRISFNASPTRLEWALMCYFEWNGVQPLTKRETEEVIRDDFSLYGFYGQDETTVHESDYDEYGNAARELLKSYWPELYA